MNAPDHEAESWPPQNIDLHDPKWVSIKEAAHLTRSDEKTVRRWTKERPIAVWTVGGRCWIDRTRLFLPQPPGAPKMPADVHSKAPPLPGILVGE